MRENLLHNFCAKKHLDEQAKKRYTISTAGGCGSAELPPLWITFIFFYRRTYLMAEEIKNPNAEE